MSETPAKMRKTTGIKVSGPANRQIVTLERDRAVSEIFGTDYPELAKSLMVHCLKVLKADEASDSLPTQDERPFMFAVIAEMEPRDTIERMLAVQMATTHVALTRTARSLANSDNLNQYQAHQTGYNKLARTFTAQMEALRKHRNGGKQTVVVQHVNVADGGQAIVGHIETGGGKNER